MRFRRLFSFKLHIKKSIGVLRLNEFVFSLIKHFKKKITRIKSEEALRILSSISTEPDGTSIGNNTIKEYKYDLQVIVPAYNVDKNI